MKEKVICHCMRVSEATVKKAIRDGARTLKAIQKATGACTGDRCKELNPKGRCCSSDIMSLLGKAPGKMPEKGGCCHR